MMYRHPSYTELDLLRETANIGSGHAATALSGLLKSPVQMRLPKVRVVPFDTLADCVGGAEKVVTAVFFQLQGDIGGSMYVLMEETGAKQLLGDLLAGDGGQEWTEMSRSALSEAGNIVAGSYLSALADFTGLKLRPSVPHLAFDMAGAVLSVGAAEIGLQADEAVMIDTAITSGDVSTYTHVILLPQPQHLSILFRAIGVTDRDR